MQYLLVHFRVEIRIRNMLPDRLLMFVMVSCLFGHMLGCYKHDIVTPPPLVCNLIYISMYIYRERYIHT